jgi:rhodanese-related sulfurtransferase
MEQNKSLINIFNNFLDDTKDDWNYITPTDFYSKYYNKKPFIVDLRQKKDFEQFHIKGATNIFWLDLMKEENLNKLPKNKTIFLICYVGHTSSQALVLLKMLGYKVVAIKFGYGKSPVFGVPVAGWLNYNYPVV